MNVTSSASTASSPSRSSGSLWRRRAGLLRFVAGPLVLLGFFLPWASGPGPYAATEFTGFTLVGFSGRLQALDLTLAQGATLWAFRLAILGVAIAAAWQLVLSPAPRIHRAYGISGWYLVGAAALLVLIGVARSGIVMPPAGFALVVLGAAAFLVSRLLPSRVTRDEEAAAR